MAWFTIFGNLAAGNQPLSLFDNMFNQIALQLAIPCAASGTNTIALTPLGLAPTLPAYNRFNMFRFRAAATSTGAVTAGFTGLATLPCYKADGVTQIGANDLLNGQEYLLVFESSLNAGGGGFYLEDAAQRSGGGGFTPISPAWQVATASATITIPTGATKCLITLVGGGGAGGAATSVACALAAGACGGSGAGLLKYLSGLTPGNTFSLTIGAAGAGGGGAGGNGGDTVLASGTQAITTLTAGKGTGGLAGSSAIQIAGAAGGAATNGDVNITGGSGFSTLTAANTLVLTQSPVAPFATGVQVIQVGTIVTGAAATGFGGGGSPGINVSPGSNTRNGGNGSAGIATFQWYS